MPDTKGDWFGRLVGAILIAEGLLVAILRFLALVYVVASEAYAADRFRTPLPSFLPWVLITVAVSLVLVWAGVLLPPRPDGGVAKSRRERSRRSGRRLPPECRRPRVGAVIGLARSPSTVEASLTWIVLGLVSLLATVGLVRDIMLRRSAG